MSDRRILAVKSGRADGTPLQPVIDALREMGVPVDAVSLEDCGLESAATVASLCYGTDIMLVLGDRYEILGAALAATVKGVPIAHIHGGETTKGAFDNQIRDAITKLSHIHFVAHKEFRDRIGFGLREDLRRIHVVGAPGLDNLTDLPPRETKKHFVVTYHPVTLEERPGIHELIDALDAFPDYEQIWTGVNTDPGNEGIMHALRGRRVEAHLGVEKYLELCRTAAAIVGNSSAGIIEAPTLEVPTVNIGRRQEGRPRSPSVFDSDEIAENIVAAILRARKFEGPYESAYGGPGASAKIAEVLSTIELDGILVK